MEVTQSRLIFQEEVTGALLLRAISIVMAFMAVSILFLGDGLGSFLPMAAASLGVWGVAKVLEMLLAQFDNALALSGAPVAAQLDRSWVQPGPWAR